MNSRTIDRIKLYIKNSNIADEPGVKFYEPSSRSHLKFFVTQIETFRKWITSK